MGGLKPAEFEPEEKYKIIAKKQCEMLGKTFTDGIRVLLLIHRNKDGSTWKNRHVDMRITRDSEEYQNDLAILEEKMWKSPLNLRIYSTVNPRNIKKAIREFKQQQLDIDYANEERITDFYVKLKGKFIGALMKPSCKQSTIFKFDLDYKDKKLIAEFVAELQKYGNLFLTRETPNGYHLFTKPFNYTLINLKKYEAEFQPDSLILVDSKI